MFRDDAPAVGIRLECRHVVTGHHEIEEGGKPQPLERRQRHRACIVRPEGRLEARAPRAPDRVERARLERGRAHRPPLVLERDRPDGALEVGRLALRPGDQLEDPVPLRPVGERSFADGLYPLSRRVLERFVAEYPNDPHAGSALFLLGRARFALGDTESALEAFRRAQAAISPAEALEAKFWEAETLFRLRRFPEARAAYDAVVKTDAAAPRAPEALYGLAWSDLELGRPETAITELRELLARWPDHALVPSATLHLARTLAEQKRFGDALPFLEGFATKYPNHKQLPDAQYLLGWARVKSGDTKAAPADLRAFGAEALLLAGESEVKLGRYGAAAKAFEAVGGVKDVEAGVRYRALAGLGLAREQLKDLRGALTAYESVVRGSPDATLRDWARERAQSVKSQLARPPAGDGKTGTGKEGGRS